MLARIDKKYCFFYQLSLPSCSMEMTYSVVNDDGRELDPGGSDQKVEAMVSHS